ncbi:hypothetical protein B0H17DRAFT_1328991 [Mycena rosella]|uniref:Uncharacterized protein n=1 Tax=Mycena rosella TaxID=1033263 RepID=A0AAD7GLT1_MYCRO|nr:hypothetical protein B0H17DRAFT_1328991 [Mycena rosella]
MRHVSFLSPSPSPSRPRFPVHSVLRPLPLLPSTSSSPLPRSFLTSTFLLPASHLLFPPPLTPQPLNHPTLQDLEAMLHCLRAVHEVLDPDAPVPALARVFAPRCGGGYQPRILPAAGRIPTARRVEEKEGRGRGGDKAETYASDFTTRAADTVLPPLRGAGAGVRVSWALGTDSGRRRRELGDRCGHHGEVALTLKSDYEEGGSRVARGCYSTLDAGRGRFAARLGLDGDAVRVCDAEARLDISRTLCATRKFLPYIRGFCRRPPVLQTLWMASLLPTLYLPAFSTLLFPVALALRSLCDANRRALAGRISAFAEVQAGLGGLPLAGTCPCLGGNGQGRRRNRSRRQHADTSSGLGEGQRAAEHRERDPGVAAIAPVEALLGPLLERLGAALGAAGTHPEAARLAAILQLEILAGVARGLTRTSNPLAFDEDESGGAEADAVRAAREDSRTGALCGALFDAIARVAELWSADSEVGQALSELFKAITAPPADMTLLLLPTQPLLGIVCRAAARQLTAVWLALTALFIAQLNPPPLILTLKSGPTAEAEAAVNGALGAIVGAALAVLCAPGGLVENSDIVQEFFACMDRVAQDFTNAFCALPDGAFDALMQCTISGLALQERYSLVAACTFLGTLIHRTALYAPLAPALLPQLQVHMIRAHGRAIMRAVLCGFAGAAPRSVTANLLELLGALVSRWDDKAVADAGGPGRGQSRARAWVVGVVFADDFFRGTLRRNVYLADADLFSLVDLSPTFRLLATHALAKRHDVHPKIMAGDFSDIQMHGIAMVRRIARFCRSIDQLRRKGEVMGLRPNRRPALAAIENARRSNLLSGLGGLLRARPPNPDPDGTPPNPTLSETRWSEFLWRMRPDNLLIVEVARADSRRLRTAIFACIERHTTIDNVELPADWSADAIPADHGCLTLAKRQLLGSGDWWLSCRSGSKIFRRTLADPLQRPELPLSAQGKNTHWWDILQVSTALQDEESLPLPLSAFLADYGLADCDWTNYDYFADYESAYYFADYDSTQYFADYHYAYYFWDPASEHYLHRHVDSYW